MRKINFKLSKQGRAAAFVAGGQMPDEDQVVEIDLEQATPGQRQVLLQGYAKELAESYRSFALYDLATDTSSQIPSWRKLDSIPTPEQALTMLVEQVPALVAWQAEHDRKDAEKKAAYELYEAKQKAMREAVRCEDEARREAEAAAKAEREAVKGAWIEANGSDRLQRAFARGHDCQRLYVLERAAVELPGYVVDFEDSAEWKGRSCPATDALDEAERVEKLGLQIGSVEIVWLTSAAKANRDDDDLYGYEPCEAVLVRQYLGKYNVVRTM